MMLTDYIIAFLSGLFAEGICTKWVQAVSSKKAVQSGVLSTVWASLILIGLGESLHHGFAACAWVLGYGLGSFLVVKYWK